MRQLLFHLLNVGVGQIHFVDNGDDGHPLFHRQMRVGNGLRLDALRGIAAMMVVLYHFTMGRHEAELGFKFGLTGVDAFFMISGFVIFMSISSVKRGIDFAINRFCRLFPTYWAAVTFTFLLLSIISVHKIGCFEPSSLLTYAVNLTMFQSYLKIPDLDGPYWTLIIEVNFYLFFW